MVSRKRWVSGEVGQLRSLVESNASVDEIAFKLNKTPGAVIVKCHRLGLPLQAKGYLDSEILVPKQLPSLEESLKILAGALEASTKAGLTKDDIRRFQIIATLARSYNDASVVYARYREVELKSQEMKEEIVQLHKMLEEFQKASPSNSS